MNAIGLRYRMLRFVVAGLFCAQCASCGFDSPESGVSPVNENPPSLFESIAGRLIVARAPLGQGLLTTCWVYNSKLDARISEHTFPGEHVREAIVSSDGNYVLVDDSDSWIVPNRRAIFAESLKVLSFDGSQFQVAQYDRHVLPARQPGDIVLDIDFDNRISILGRGNELLVYEANSKTLTRLEFPKQLEPEDILTARISANGGRVTLVADGHHEEYHPDVYYDDSYRADRASGWRVEFVGPFVEVSLADEAATLLLRSCAQRLNQIGLSTGRGPVVVWSDIATSFYYLGVLIDGHSVVLVSSLPDTAFETWFQPYRIEGGALSKGKAFGKATRENIYYETR